VSAQRLPRQTAPALATLFALMLAMPGRADPLHFELDPLGPIILGLDGSLTYTRSTGNFHSQTFTFAFGSVEFPLGTFSPGSLTTVDLTVNAAGGFLANGTGLSVTGDLDLDNDGINDASGLLLSGPILDFGAEAAGPPTRVFNGLFDVQGGALTAPVALSGGGTATAQFPVGARGGFFLFAETVTNGTLGDFSADFASDNVKDNVGLVVPAPATWLLAMPGAAALVGGAITARRRRPG
jgi:hypothetical protein